MIVLGKDASVGWFVSGYVRLLQSQYESKSARTVLKIILKPKSGGLFLVNARPFPEHSSSIATFSAGRAWLEASRSSVRARTLPGFLTTESNHSLWRFIFYFFFPFVRW